VVAGCGFRGGGAVTKIMLDPSTSDKLQGFKDPIQLCDPTGRILGQFVPSSSMSEWEPVTPDVTEEELSRRLNSQEKRYSTAEILKRLESL
jgi:hypothetical protein